MKKSLLIAGALLWLLAAAPGHATTLLWMDVPDLTRHSTSVVHGTVVAQHTLAEQPGVPLNQVTVEIEDTLKGELQGTVVVVNPGFAGAPAFQDGDELVLFISTRDGTHVITGFQQGSFRIVTDPAGRKVLDRAIPSRDKSLAGVRSVEALLNEIRSAVEEEGRP
jgi:hypothetical protein